MLLLLTLDTFSRTGGIQQFNRCLQLALCRWAMQQGEPFTHLSLQDTTEQLNASYAEGNRFSFRGFAGRKAAFVRAAIAAGSRSHTLVFGHVNLAAIALWPSFGKKRLILAAHGIEVWQPLPFRKRVALQRMQTLLAVSHFTANKLQQLQGVDAGRIKIFPNTLDPFFAGMPLLPPARWNRNWRIDAGGTYLLTVARLSQTEGAKGYDEVLRALPELIKSVPGLYYILAGKADDAEYDRVRQLARNLGVDNRLMMPGFVPPTHLPALYNLAKTFVLPSTKEGFGIVYLEAAWWGCSTIACESGGVPDALLNGQLGTLIPPGDFPSLVHALQHALLSEQPRQTLLARNRPLIEEHFGFSRFCGRLSGILSES